MCVTVIFSVSLTWKGGECLDDCAKCSHTQQSVFISKFWVCMNQIESIAIYVRKSSNRTLKMNLKIATVNDNAMQSSDFVKWCHTAPERKLADCVSKCNRASRFRPSAILIKAMNGTSRYIWRTRRQKLYFLVQSSVTATLKTAVPKLCLMMPC